MTKKSDLSQYNEILNKISEVKPKNIFVTIGVTVVGGLIVAWLGVNQIKADLVSFREDQSKANTAIQQSVEKIEIEVSETKQAVNEIKTEVSDLKRDTTEMKSDIADLKKYKDDSNSQVAELKGRMDGYDKQLQIVKYNFEQKEDDLREENWELRQKNEDLQKAKKPGLKK